MIIVYLSIAVAIAACIFLAVYGVRFKKATEPAAKKVVDVSGNMQQRMDNIKKEREKLESRVDVMKEDMAYKTSVIRGVVSEVKGTASFVKDGWTSLREMPNPLIVPRMEVRPEVRQLARDVVELCEKIRHWRR